MKRERLKKHYNQRKQTAYFPSYKKGDLRRYMGGYVGGYTAGSKISITIMNYILAGFLLVVGSPVLLVIALIIKIKDPGPVFYKGERLGMHKKIFLMYKFRTLPIGAQERIGPKLLSPHDYRLPFFSKFLRDTRLDELPQLFNILKGEMDFIGPRPLRPEIYEKMCGNIKGFDRRFEVRPGMIGYSQLFTPHSSPKKIRALIDNKLVHLKRSCVIDLFFIVLTILIVIKKAVVLLAKAFWKYIIKIKILREFDEEKRALDRVKIDGVTVRVLSLDQHLICQGLLRDMNESFFKFESDKKLTDGTKEGEFFLRLDLKDEEDSEGSEENEKRSYLFHLRKMIKRKGKKKIKTGKCLGEIFREWEQEEKGKKKYIYVIKYKPLNQFNQYCIDQYFLDKSVMHYF